MKQTRYQHDYQEDTTTQSYFYDCVGMVTYSLSLGAPAAYQEIMDGLKIARGYVPSPALYVQWFSGLTTHEPPVAAWQPVATVAEIQPGYVLAWPLEGNNPVGAGGATGHSVIAGGPPLLLSDGSYYYSDTSTARATTRTCVERNDSPSRNLSRFGAGAPARKCHCSTMPCLSMTPRPRAMGRSIAATPTRAICRSRFPAVPSVIPAD